MRMSSQLSFDPPQGVIKFKYVAVRDNEDFPEEAVIGPVSTAKSSMLIDFLMRRAFDYPGSNALLARATLKALRDSTLVRLNQRWGSVFLEMGGSQNENQGIYRLPPVTHPVTGGKTQSMIRAIGLDRTDLEHTLRSAEFATSAMEEADEIPTDAIDMVQFRSRQQIFHRTKTVEDLCIKLSQQWGGLHPDDVYFILKSDKRHAVGQGQLPMDHPMPGETVMKLAWNPMGDIPVWQRMVGLPYPDPNPTPDWVKSHIGVREVRVPYEKHSERHYRFMAGSIVMLKNGKRRFAARHDEDKGVVYLVPDLKDPGAPVKVPVEDTTLIVQRNTIYVFPHENESRDFRNDERSFLAQNEGLARQFFLGASTDRNKRVFPDYVDDYVENGGHLVRWPGKRIVADKKWPIIGGLDKGGRHAHATTAAIVAPETGRAIIYAEYVRTGVGARDHALDSQALILPGNGGVTWGYDPSLDARRYDTDAEYRTIEEYEEVLGEGALFHGTRGDEGFELVQRLLMPYAGNIGEKSAPRLLVFDNMKHVREALLRLTWRMVDRERDNYLVDVGDAIKYMASVLHQVSTLDDVPPEIFTPRLAYRA